MRGNPDLMLEETINEAEVINRRESLLIENGESYKWYSDTTKEMIEGIVLEVKSMMKVVIKLANNSFELQSSKFSSKGVHSEDHHEMSFMKRYHASNEIAVERIKMETNILQQKRSIHFKDSQISKSRKEVMDKVVKISELEEKMEGLTEELQAWEQKKGREER